MYITFDSIYCNLYSVKNESNPGSKQYRCMAHFIQNMNFYNSFYKKFNTIMCRLRN